MSSCHRSILFIIYSLFLNNVLLQNPPVIIETPKDSFSKYPSKLELLCQADGDPQPEISWYNAQTKKKITKAILVSGVLYPVSITRAGTLSRLIINTVERDKQFAAYCNASNSLGHAISPTATAAEAYINNLFQLDLPIITKINPGNTALFSCKAPKGRPSPKITWLKNSITIDTINNARYEILTDYKSQTSTLKIINSKSDDLGYYQCLAENSYGRKKSSTSSLSFIQPLKVSKELTFTAENSGNITCPISTQKLFEWVRQDGRKLDPFRIIHREGYLSIINIQQSDSGKYICRTLPQSGEAVEALISVIVQSQATFLVTPEDKSVFVGDYVIFKCIVSGEPLPEVYWEVPGLSALFPEDTANSRFKVKKDGSLHINNVKLIDAGKVTCNCHSSLGSKHSSAHLTVKKRDLAHYPVISLPPQNQTLLEGSTATFRCEVVSHLDAIITWYRGPNNELLQPSDKISIPIRGALQINKVDPSKDTNIYTCEASTKNDGMKTRWTAFLRVIELLSTIELKTPVNDESELPLPPVLDTPFVLSSDSVTLSWTSPGNSKFWIEYVRFGSPDGWIIYAKDWQNTKITVMNLEPDSWYQFIVRARNPKALSRASVPTEYIKTISRPLSKLDVNNPNVRLISQIQITIFDIHPIQFGKVKVEWHMSVPESFELAVIAGFKIRYTMIPLGRCLDYAQLPNLPKKTYCSLNDRSKDDIKKWIDHNDLMSLPSTYNVHANHTSGIADVQMRVTDPNSVMKGLVTGLSPFSCYELSVEAYSGLSVSSPESPSRLSLMMENIPNQPPQHIKIFWSQTINVLLIQWKLPPKHSWNGILTGFTVHMFANDSQSLLGSFKFSNITTEIQIKNVDQTQKYSIHMSLSNCQGEGIRSKRIQVARKLQVSSTYEQQLWFIPVIVVGTLIFWVMLCSLVVYLCCVRYHLISASPKFKSKNREINLQPLISNSTKDGRFMMSRSLNSHDNHQDDLYSEPSAINPNQLTACSVTSGSITPYASTSIVDHPENSYVLNTFCKFYTGPMMDELGPSQAAILPPYPSFSSQYTSYPHSSVLMPFSMNTSASPNPLNSTSINSPLYGTKDDNYPASNVQHGKYMNPSNPAINYAANVKMGLSQLASSTSGTSSAGSASQKKTQDKKVGSMLNCSAVSPATFGSSSPSQSALATDYTANEEQDLGNGSLKSVVLYDVIPSGETGDECHGDSSQSSDMNNEDYESGNDVDMDVEIGNNTGTTIDDGSTDSVTYSSVPHRPYPKNCRRKQMRHKYQSGKPKL